MWYVNAIFGIQMWENVFCYEVVRKGGIRVEC